MTKTTEMRDRECLELREFLEIAFAFALRGQLPFVHGFQASVNETHAIQSQ